MFFLCYPGEVEFDAIVKRDGKKVWASAADLVEANGSKSLSLVWLGFNGFDVKPLKMVYNIG